MDVELHYRTIEAGNANISYIEAGSPEFPTLLLMHGFPSSAAQYATLIPLLATSYHILAPSMPGFGDTQVATGYEYSFASLATTIGQFLTAMNVERYAAYIFDYGAPVLLRLLVEASEAVGSNQTYTSDNIPGNTPSNSSSSSSSSGGSGSNSTKVPTIAALITQNGNAYKVGLGADFWAPVERYWASNSSADREFLRTNVLNFTAIESQYRIGVPSYKQSRVPPQLYTLDYLQNVSPDSGRQDIQLDLFYDCRNNVAMYPQFQAWFRKTQIPLLAVWGKGDIAFVPAGAEAFKQDLPKATVRFLDTGHFAVATDVVALARYVRVFLGGLGY